ncbi:MAG: DUF3596 domain-containing protein [Pseudomonadota bacterium]
MDRKLGVTQRGQSIQISFQYHGIRCRETLRLEPTKANFMYASRLKAAIELEIEKGIFTYSKHFPQSKNALLGSNTSNKTVARAFDDYLQATRKSCAVSTWRNYKSAIEYHLKPTFGHLRLVDVTSTEIRKWISTLEISNKRINNVLIPLRTIMNDAHADGLIDRNPVTRISNLSVKFDDPQPFTPTEIAAIYKTLPQQGKNLVQFALWTGLRTSELIALEWGDIDWIKGYIRVRRACVNKITKVPKTKSGERDVKILPPALEALIDQKQYSFLADGRIFHNPRTNTPWETDGQIRKTMWQPALKKAGVLYRIPYQLRHSYASTLLSAGENPMWVAQQMGHKDWGMIRKRYGRYIPEVDNQAGSKIISHLAQIGHKVNASD